MRIEVNRVDYSNVSTVGELYVDGKFQCYTLEDQVRQPDVKVFGKTAIPSGAYNVTLTFSPHFNRILPLLNSVHNFEGVRIHPGNDANDTEGCILVGDAKGVNFIGDSVKAFNALFPLMEAANKAGEDITIVINDTYAAAPTVDAPAVSSPVTAGRKRSKGDAE